MQTKSFILGDSFGTRIGTNEPVDLNKQLKSSYIYFNILLATTRHRMSINDVKN